MTKVTVDNALQNSEFRLCREGRADFPINVLVRLLDVPVSDTGMLIDWGNQMVANTDPDYTDHLITDPDSDQYRHLPFRSQRRSSVRVRSILPDGAKAATAPT